MVAARRRGPAAVLEARWQSLLASWRWSRDVHAVRRPGNTFRGVVPLLEAAYAEPRLRQLYPFTSHWNLLFSNRIGYPHDVTAPLVVPLSDGRFRVHDRRSETVVGEAGTAQEAIELVIAHLPADLGPAIAGDPD